MKSKQICPICTKDMIEENKIKYIDYYCRERADHFYACRILNNEQIKIKMRFTDTLENGTKEKLFLKVNFDEGTSQVWTKNNDNNRIQIDQIFNPDFSDLDKLKVKIRTYLLFS